MGVLTVGLRADFDTQQHIPRSNSAIKWGSVTRILSSRPLVWGDLEGRVALLDRDPEAHDVMIAQIQSVGHHTRLELDHGERSVMFPGDLVGVVFGHRYATRQLHGVVPNALPVYDMLSQGGVCGKVVSGPSDMKIATKIRPLGFLVDDLNNVVNLRDQGLAPVAVDASPKIIVVVGSSMDAGKTSLAAGIVHGLVRGGNRVNAGKLSGTGCLKDVNLMRDAGAIRVMDFTDAGYASTFNCSEGELAVICETLITNLSTDHPDYLLLEIADGIIQAETKLILDYLSKSGQLHSVGLAVHDVMAAPACIELLKREWNAEVSIISGVGTVTPLSTGELQEMVSVPCWSHEELHHPGVEELF